MPTIPLHLRHNHERTDDVLMNLRGLAFAFDMLHEAHDAPDPNSRKSLAKSTVLRLLMDRFDELDMARGLEWAGIGGNSPYLTPDQVAAARGKSQG